MIKVAILISFFADVETIWINIWTKICNKKITFQCIIFIVPEEGWFGQPKYSTHIKTFLRCTGFCLYFLHFIYVKPVRSPLIQRTPAGSSFRLLAQTLYNYSLYIVAIFANFQNCFISQIIAAFFSRYLHRTISMCLWSRFSHLFRIFIF